MLDYRQIEALAKVIQEGGFERAAQSLFLTQSAVSQRVKQLEEASGQILISRTTPPQPTAAGKVLLKHYQHVKLLEEGLSSSLSVTPESKLTTLAIGINADSLAHWFIAAISPILEKMDLLLDLRVDDQEQTHNYLREGEVVGCISTEPKAMQGCRVVELGTIVYRLLATPDFINRWFSDGLSLKAAKRAPAVIFNRQDRLHYQFFEKYLSAKPLSFPAHYIPSYSQFFEMIAAGYGYGMAPDWQGKALLDSGELHEIIPGATLPINLYWHCWNLDAHPLQEFSDQLLAGAKQLLTKN